MADFNTFSNTAYSVNGGGSGLHTAAGSTNDTNGALTEKIGNGSENGTFNVGELFNFPGFGWDMEFVGTILSTSGDTLYVFIDPTFPFFYDVFATSDLATADFPSQFQTSDINTSYNEAFCFAEGSLIATPAGDVAIETLGIGDIVQSARGDSVTVKWIGRQTVSTRFGPAERLMPVRFAAGSLGNGLPHRDLTVTADHGMLVDGVICHAGALVNGTTITRVPLAEIGETYTVYHIETEEHEIILANGAPAETFIDNVSRKVFDNYAEFEALYGDVPEMAELPYPRAMSARQVPQLIQRALGARAIA